MDGNVQEREIASIVLAAIQAYIQTLMDEKELLLKAGSRKTWHGGQKRQKQNSLNCVEKWTPQIMALESQKLRLLDSARGYCSHSA